MPVLALIGINQDCLICRGISTKISRTGLGARWSPQGFYFIFKLEFYFHSSFENEFYHWLQDQVTSEQKNLNESKSEQNKVISAVYMTALNYQRQ